MTPETDKAERMAFANEYMVPTEVARRLERERDEAREEIEHMKSLLLDPHAVHINFLHGKIAKLDWDKLEHIHGPHPARKERDEAREALREIEAADWKTSGELRGMARKALEAAK